MPIVTGLSGNEMYCLEKKGYQAGDLVVGNSVWSLGLLSSLTSLAKTIAGGEVSQYTEWINNGRRRAYEKLIREAEQRGGRGITGVTSELVMHPVGLEFLSIGSCIHSDEQNENFSTSADGQGLYCQLDCGFRPVRFVFGNVAYSIGIGGGLAGALRSMARGEVKEWSEVFNRTRHLALDRIRAEAKAAGANAVLGIRTTITPFYGSREMIMIGTASHHPALPPEYTQEPITSDLTNQEMWNVIRQGYCPIRLVLGVSVYSIGMVGSFSSLFKSLVSGEIKEMTALIYDARENAIAKIARDAEACGADDVVGVRTYIKNLSGGVVEFMAIGTAVKRIPGVETLSENLPPQAVMHDSDTFIEPSLGMSSYNLNAPSG
ncbi:heavy metal-binding domain-containing protein [bacterium]|nr:heavy metal-binding domain-containing protein [bacterium]